MKETQASGLKVRIVGGGEPFSANPETSVLQSLAQGAGKVITVGCRGGGCGVCKIRVLAGEYRRGPMSKVHISAQEADAGYCLACRTYPRSDVLIEVCGKIPAKFQGR